MEGEIREISYDECLSLASALNFARKNPERMYLNDEQQAVLNRLYKDLINDRISILIKRD